LTKADAGIESIQAGLNEIEDGLLKVKQGLAELGDSIQRARLELAKAREDAIVWWGRAKKAGSGVRRTRAKSTERGG